MTASPSKIAVRGLRKSFGPKQVLRGVDLDVARGENLVVVGSSGAGKSVLLKCVAGLLAPDAGSVRVDGEETAGLRGAARRRTGMLFQGAALFDSLRLWENVAFGLDGLGRREARDAAVALLAEVGLGPEAADRYPAELSAGARKRAGLARAIAPRPELLFFDEPTTGIDPLMGDVIDRLIARCVAELGATALTITHDMESARRIGSRVVMLHQGRATWSGGVGELLDSGDPVVDQFVRGRVEGPIRIEGRAAAPGSA